MEKSVLFCGRADSSYGLRGGMDLITAIVMKVIFCIAVESVCTNNLYKS